MTGGGRSASVRIHVPDLRKIVSYLNPEGSNSARLITEYLEQTFGERLDARYWYIDVCTDPGSPSAAEFQAGLESYYRRLAASARTAVRQHLMTAQLLLLGELQYLLRLISRIGY